jgi:hypothetical protein
MSETRILIRFLRMHFLWSWELGSALINFGIGGVGGGVEPTNAPLGTPLDVHHVL